MGPVLLWPAASERETAFHLSSFAYREGERGLFSFLLSLSNVPPSRVISRVLQTNNRA